MMERIRQALKNPSLRARLLMALAALAACALLLGAQGDEMIDADEMAAWLGTISYEVLCSPGKRVPRVYMHE